MPGSLPCPGQAVCWLVATRAGGADSSETFYTVYFTAVYRQTCCWNTSGSVDNRKTHSWQFTTSSTCGAVNDTGLSIAFILLIFTVYIMQMHRLSPVQATALES
jgi:hypothetical protein